MHGITENVGGITGKIEIDFANMYGNYLGRPALNNCVVEQHASQQKSLKHKRVLASAIAGRLVAADVYRRTGWNAFISYRPTKPTVKLLAFIAWSLNALPQKAHLAFM